MVPHGENRGSRLRVVSRVVVVVLGLIALVPVVHGRLWLAGESPSSYYAWLMDDPRVGVPARLGVRLVWHPHDSAMAEAHIELPTGMELLSGDTLWVGRPGILSGLWTLRVRRLAEAPMEIRGRVSVQRTDGGLDMGEWTLALSGGDSTKAGAVCTVTKEETIRKGRRYRYGFEFLVPIEADENVTHSALRAHGSRPRVTATAPIVDSLLTVVPPGGSIPVRLVVFVGRAGEVTGVRVWTPPGDQIEEMCLRSLRAHWSFAPARLHGTPYSDWLLVDATVVSP